MNDISTPRLPLRPALADTPRVPPAERPALDVWLVLRRQKWPLIVGACLGLLAGMTHYATSPRMYYTAATVMVNEQTNDPTLEFMAGVPLMRNETAVLNQMQVLRSLQMAEQVVRELDLHNTPSFTAPPSSLARQLVTDLKGRVRALLPLQDPPDPAGGVAEEARILGAALRLQRDLDIVRVGRSFSIELSLVHHDRFLAAAVANAYAAAFLADSQSANQDAAGRSAAWLRTHIENVRAAANDAAREAAEFRAENRASDMQGLRELEQRAQTLNDLHAALLGRLEMIAIEGSYPVSGGRLLSEAVVPRDPALPKAWRLLAAGLVLGLMGGMCVAAVRELRETGLRTGEDVRTATGLGFLGYLPRFRKGRLARMRPVVEQAPAKAPEMPFISRRPQGSASFKLAWRPLATPMTRPVQGRRLPGSVAPSLFIPALSPDSIYAESLKNVLATIARGMPPGGQVIAVGSLNPKEGRTTVAANLAQLSALEGHRTLLIDADVLNPGLSAALSIREGPGLSDVLTDGAGLDEAVVTLPVSGLDVLPSMRPSGMTTLPNAVRMSRLLAEARASYDVVVVDSQPLGLSSDIKSVLASLDAVVIVAAWGRTRRGALEQYVANEPELAQKVAGVVLNRAVMRRLGAYGVALEGKRYIGARAFA
jgi:capsular exopolysaccharide synthesis family protein